MMAKSLKSDTTNLSPPMQPGILTLLFQKAPPGFISEALGHKSLQTTEAYLDSFEDETRQKYAQMLVPK